MSDHYELDTSILDRLIQTTPEELSVWWDGVAESMTNDIKMSFNTSPAGISYKRKNGIVHVASAPGYPPNIDLGALVNSMHWEEIAALTRHIMDGVDYGIKLEEGTSKMLPRPFIQPVFAAWRNGKLERDALAYGIITP